MSKVVLITGASSGIGESIATFLNDKGFIVYGTSRNPKNIEKYPFKLIALDVTKKETIQKAVETVVENEGRLDILINNAGMGITGAVEETPVNEMKAVFDTNFYGVVDCIQIAAPYLRKNKESLIINVTSIAGYMGLPFRGVYSSVKGALKILTESLNMEMQQFGIDVVSVAPGDFATNIAAGRYHTPVFDDSPYKEVYQRNLDLMDAHVDDGKDPEVMAKAVLKIINSKKRKIHYEVGAFMEKFSIVLKAILPDKVYQKLLMNHYKM